jgi:cytochrome c oxidase assembly protein subunit 15
MEPTPTDSHPSRTPGFKPGLAAFAVVSAVWVFVLVTLGAFTTSIGAGMAFPDWPLSNGSLNPSGWLTNIAMFAEHSHRLSAGLMTLLTIALAVWLWRTETRPWLRSLSLFAVGLVLLQAVVGGLRVLLEPVLVSSVDTTLGRLFAMLHACLAQGLACTLLAIAVSCSAAWITRPLPIGAAVRRVGKACCVLLFLQLGIAAVMRHSFAGLSIPTFPWSTPDGGILPDAWNFRVAIQFAHRVMACMITLAVVAYAVLIWRDRSSTPAMRSGGSTLVSLVALQIMIGAAIIRTMRNPTITTVHVLVGALTLATAFWLTWLAHRDSIEGTPAP